MAAHAQNDDVQAIKELIGGHFRGLRWTPSTRPDGPHSPPTSCQMPRSFQLLVRCEDKRSMPLLRE